MKASEIRDLWVEEAGELEEILVPLEMLPKRLREKNANLILRALDAEEGLEISELAKDDDGKMIQRKFIALLLARSLRNADEPDKPLIWDETFIDKMLKTRVGTLMDLFKLSSKHSGLQNDEPQKQKKG